MRGLGDAKSCTESIVSYVRVQCRPYQDLYLSVFWYLEVTVPNCSTWDSFPSILLFFSIPPFSSGGIFSSLHQVWLAQLLCSGIPSQTCIIPQMKWFNSFSSPIYSSGIESIFFSSHAKGELSFKYRWESARKKKRGLNGSIGLTRPARSQASFSLDPLMNGWPNVKKNFFASLSERMKNMRCLLTTWKKKKRANCVREFALSILRESHANKERFFPAMTNELPCRQTRRKRPLFFLLLLFYQNRVGSLVRMRLDQSK